MPRRSNAGQRKQIRQAARWFSAPDPRQHCSPAGSYQGTEGRLTGWDAIRQYFGSPQYVRPAFAYNVPCPCPVTPSKDSPPRSIDGCVSITIAAAILVAIPLRQFGSGSACYRSKKPATMQAEPSMRMQSQSRQAPKAITRYETTPRQMPKLARPTRPGFFSLRLRVCLQ